MAEFINKGLYNFLEFSFEQLPPSGNLLKDMQEDKLDGVVISGIFDANELKAFQSQFQKFSEQIKGSDLYAETDFGSVIGSSLMENNLKAYLDRACRSLNFFESVFQGNFCSLVTGVLSKLTGGQRVFQARFPDTDKSTSPASVRICKPEHKALNAHIHREFGLYFPLYQKIAAISRLETELSYYLMLQKPSSGGALTLYDLQWHNTPKEYIRPEVFMAEQRNNFLDNLDQMHISLSEGEMIIFAANRIWHKINAVQGDTNRITIGGFITESLDSRYQYYWI
ncbi:hypothetical protein GM3708_2214 [Geminocystis sp. NIES-3708]|uniref:2OG-Fe(II)-dependent halogenase WelO5 family protein n=1 Tax=Geminocystis sp. NIES-3708 TaxID=1615909 RepID=UPI0005FCC2B9|nr:hypothetical protein [Geminocystis sp. NIES-3708]BAQ61808.1 hypothetical protein GM3708_2214 [Geminocystis sp. NIES-3708]